MTLEETGVIMDIFKATYPQFYKGQPDKERLKATALWASMFADDDFAVVAAAVKAFIATDEKGFPPVIGMIKNKIADIQNPDTMTEYEAWNLVRNAIGNSGGGITCEGYYKGGVYSETYQKNAYLTMIDGKLIYRTGGEYVCVRKYDSCEEEFNKLPYILQRLVGSANKLREWARMNSETLETVVGSNFMRSYRARAANEREYAMLPDDVKKVMSAVAERMKLPEARQMTEYEINERRNEIRQQLEDGV